MARDDNADLAGYMQHLYKMEGLKTFDEWKALKRSVIEGETAKLFNLQNKALFSEDQTVPTVRRRQRYPQQDFSDYIGDNDDEYVLREQEDWGSGWGWQ